MIHWLKQPNNAQIAKYIDCYWFLEKLPTADGVDYPKLNPEPSTHLILAQPKQHFQYKSDNDVLEPTGSHWLYPYGKTYQLDHSKAVACIGIKFKVGALYSLPKLNAWQTKTSKALINTIDTVNFAHINSEQSGFNKANSAGTNDRNIDIDENALLNMARSAPDKCSQLLDNLCLPWLANTHEDNHSKTTRRVLALLNSTSINEMGKALNCSQRTLERSFLKVTGLTLKQCQSMNRLEAILAFLYQRKQSEIDWLDIAYQFGFSDQPHLIRYLKKHIGLTPQDYAQQRGFTIDVYGGVASL